MDIELVAGRPGLALFEVVIHKHVSVIQDIIISEGIGKSAEEIHAVNLNGIRHSAAGYVEVHKVLLAALAVGDLRDVFKVNVIRMIRNHDGRRRAGLVTVELHAADVPGARGDPVEVALIDGLFNRAEGGIFGELQRIGAVDHCDIAVGAVLVGGRAAPDLGSCGSIHQADHFLVVPVLGIVGRTVVPV